MSFSRNTYLEIDLEKIKNNVKTVINNYPAYKYYFGVVKANCYGLDNESLAVTKAIIDAGCNYLAVATLEEAIAIRKEFKSIPILVLGHISKEHINEAIAYNITVTIHSKENLEEIVEQNLDGLKVHIKINTGMNRLGINKGLKVLYDKCIENKINVEGIFTRTQLLFTLGNHRSQPANCRFGAERRIDARTDRLRFNVKAPDYPLHA